MIQIHRITNVFEPTKTQREDSIYLGTTLDKYTGDYTYWDVYLNGRYVPKEDIPKTTPLDGAFIVITPHVGGGLKGVFKSLLQVAAMAALMSFTSGIAANGIWGITGKTLGSYLVAGAVMTLGGRLINSIFPQSKSTTSDSTTSQTYGWSIPTISTIEGGIIGETYGECLPQGQLLMQHVETASNGKQYLNMLLCGGYGEVDSITDIRIDSTPIGNYNNVEVEYRLGTNDQEPISFFADTPLDQSVGLNLDMELPITRTTDATMATSLEVTMEWSAGLYHMSSKGKYKSTTVSFQIEYRLTGTSDWVDGGTYDVSASSSTAFSKAFKFAEGLTPGQYDVRVTTLKKDSGSRDQTTTTWSLLTAYNEGRYSRPNKVLVALRILATSQLSGGIPNVNWRQKRSTVYVYNPRTNEYEAKQANNPIWATYDILHGCRRLKNTLTGQYEYTVFGCAHTALDAYYDQWVEAAAYADEMVVNQDGVLEKRFLFDAYFDTAQRRFDAAVKAAAVGHAAIIVHGTQYGIVVDKPAGISQVFSEGRTTVSSIQGTFTSKEERAHAVEITYNDTQNDFKNTMFTLYSPTFATSDEQQNTTQLTLFGVKRRSQAYREGVYALATAERQLQFIELSTDINGLVAEYGDVVGYSHTVSRIGIASGRIKSATSTTITLDQSVTMEGSGTYEVYVTLQNDKLIHREVVAVEGTTNTLTLSTPFDSDAIPKEYDNFAFGAYGKAVKPYRIVGAERDGDLNVKLKLAEYDEAIYSETLDYSNYPVIDYTENSGVEDWEVAIQEAIANNNIDITVIGTGGYSIAYQNAIKNNELVFDTTLDLISNGTYGLSFGLVVRTLGYREKLDDGGARFSLDYIYDPENYPWAIELGKSSEYEYQLELRPDGTPEVDENGEYILSRDAKGNYIPLYDDEGAHKYKTMYAVIMETTVNYSMFGAYLDGEADDYEPIRLAHAYQHDTYKIEALSGRRFYPITVANHKGIIRKDNNSPIICSGNVDLSGSQLLVQDVNATWFGFYLWGDNEEDYYAYEPDVTAKESYEKDKFVIDIAGNGENLASNSFLIVKEDPYSIRDDSGYLYSEPRYELLLHTQDGLLANPFTYDWSQAGGMEIKTPVSDYVTHEVSTQTYNSELTVSYNRIPAAHYTFKGCNVKLATSANTYCSVLWCKCHNAHITNFTVEVDTDQLHNTRFKNAIFYIWGAYNVEVSNIVGMNAAGKKGTDGTKGTSGYLIRATNCLELNIHDISAQGYWGATSMNCVKDVHFTRVSINRIDIHNYFYNLYIDQCKLFNSAIQIGEGRGICQVTNSTFFYNPLDGESYPHTHVVEFNSTYGRVFEGRVYIENCNVYIRDPADNELDVCKFEFSPEAVSILDTFKFPEITIRDCHFHSYADNTYLCYINVSGSRNCKTSTSKPTNIANSCRDTGNDDTGTLVWKYLGRGVDWVDDGDSTKLDVVAGQYVRTYDRFLDSEGKTVFYNTRYFLVTQGGTLDYPTSDNAPSNITGSEFACGTAKLKYVEPSRAQWQANSSYAVGEYCLVDTSEWLPVFCWQCTRAGVSNGYRPVHTSGTVIDGVDVYPQEQDSIWWEYVDTKDSFVTKTFTAGMSVSAGDILYADHKLYRVESGGILTSIPPQNTGWDGVAFTNGTASLIFIGKDWAVQTWFKVGFYCVSTAADGTASIYLSKDHDGTTSGNIPVRGNACTIDGDIIWKWIGSVDDEGEDNTTSLPASEWSDLKTASSTPTAPTIVGTRILDGTLPVEWLGAVYYAWRVAGASYEVGDIVCDNTFVIQCVVAGTTNANNRWGPVESAAWSSSGTIVDGTVTWQKLTDTSANGAWRSGNTNYPIGTILIADAVASNAYNFYRVVASLEEDGGDDTAETGSNAWKASTSYSMGDVVQSAGNEYQCVFDGKLELPAQIVIENITTNMTVGGDVFAFYTNNCDIPTRYGESGAFRIKVANVDLYRFRDYDYYFGHAGNPAPTVEDLQSEVTTLQAQLASAQSTIDSLNKTLIAQNASTQKAIDEILTKISASSE